MVSKRVALVLALAGCATQSATAPPAKPVAPAVVSGYDKPPKNVLDVLHAPAPPAPFVSPTGDTLLLATAVEYPPIQQVAEPFLRLAGVRVEPRTRRKHDTPGGYGISACFSDFTLVQVATGAATKVALPAGCAESALFSPDGKRLVFRNVTGSAVELWIADVASGTVRRVDGLAMNPMLARATTWMPDGKTLLVKAVPENPGAAPAEGEVLVGPSIQETDGGKGQSSTYETRDTLRNKHDEALFDYYGSAQLALVDTVAGSVSRVGKPAIVDAMYPSPDGQHLLVEHIVRPYSYVTTYDNFPHEIEIWDKAGNLEKKVASQPLAERVPIRGVRTGPRDFEWRPSTPATVVWAEALDGGDPNAKAPERDKLMMMVAPFTAPVEMVRLEQRYADLQWSEKASLALVSEFDVNRHWERTFTMNPDDASSKKVLFDLSSDEQYQNPGSPVVRMAPNGTFVLRQEGDAIFLAGNGSTPDGDRPFLDRLDLKTRKSERIFQSDKTALERFLGFSDQSQRFLTWHQSPADPPNAFVRTVGTAEPTALTHIPDPSPEVRAIKKRLVKYKRKDGVDLSFTLYTPPGYQEGTRVPAILYAYPLDYADPTKAGQVTGSELTFTRLRNYRLLLLSGYAIIDNAAFPIVGDPKKAYDTYLDQLVADATAAVEKAVEIGVVDPDRVGVTGHSHGALMTANLVAHSELFRAGVATSGSYNKTLTPFGFQNERRSVWQAQDVYLQVSTFFFADKMKAPLLIMHGEDDANPGTTPIQAQKLYEAIRGNGGTARLVMLPHEPHWYSAMESNEQLAAEEIKWFDRYVKNAPPRPKVGRN